MSARQLLGSPKYCRPQAERDTNGYSRSRSRAPRQECVGKCAGDGGVTVLARPALYVMNSATGKVKGEDVGWSGGFWQKKALAENRRWPGWSCVTFGCEWLTRIPATIA